MDYYARQTAIGLKQAIEEILKLPVPTEPEPEVIRIDDAPNVVIELVPPDHNDALPPGRSATPAGG